MIKENCNVGWVDIGIVRKVRRISVVPHGKYRKWQKLWGFCRPVTALSLGHAYGTEIVN
jgi:hypothetical protein